MRSVLSSPAARGDGTCTDVLISGYGIIQLPESFINKCIDHAARLPLQAELDGKLTPLEQLGLEMLLHFSYQGDLLHKPNQSEQPACASTTTTS
jgi:hypothetical protein